ncbi:MAG: hypothetical protein HZA89_17395 [Verrucomicrobia bacterium]|nr:hypothetical protein [Verrucomicrobiota bacterium]
MKNHCFLILLLSLLLAAPLAHAQGTAFSYQGQLTLSGVPASGNWDIICRLYDADTAGNQVGASVTNLNVPVANGLFAVTLDFGTNFNGASRWLEVAACTNGAGVFITVDPRQAITPTPYAIFAGTAATAATANSVAAANITGTLAGAQIAAGSVAAPLNSSGTNVQATANTVYNATNVAQVTFLLPTNANVGDVVQVNGAGAGGWTVGTNQNSLTWTARESSRSWYSVASSADGAKLVAVVLGGQIYTSTDSGVTWTARESSRNWFSVASSADGTKLVAVEGGGQIYTSTDSGVTWTARESTRDWSSVASSADGTKLVAGAYGGQIYTSTNSGVSWTPRDSSRSWQSVASSSDGTKLVAAVEGGQIYTSTD